MRKKVLGQYVNVSERKVKGDGEKSRRIRWAWHVARMGEMRNSCKFVTGKHEGKGPLGKSRHRWE
jgi:hypothetical protein